MTTTHNNEKSGPRPDGSPGEVLCAGGDRSRHDELHDGAQEYRHPSVLSLGAISADRLGEVIGGVEARVRDGEEKDAEEREGEEDAPRASVEKKEKHDFRTTWQPMPGLQSPTCPRSDRFCRPSASAPRPRPPSATATSSTGAWRSATARWSVRPPSPSTCSSRCRRRKRGRWRPWNYWKAM